MSVIKSRWIEEGEGIGFFQRLEKERRRVMIICETW